MPIYEYQAEDPKKSCRHCRDAFEVVRQAGDEPLGKCPECGSPVVKIISVPGKPKENILSPKSLADKGFTQYKNVGGGHFEKSAGEGPDVLKDG